MAMAIRGGRRAKEVVLVRVHVGNMEKTATEVPARLGLLEICPLYRRSDRKGFEEGREKTQHDCLGPV